MFHPSDDGADFIEEAKQDVGDRVALNKALYNETRSGWGDGQRVASIPTVVWESLIHKGIVTASGQVLDMPRFKAFLNDPDNRAFRTRPGRI